MGMYTKVKFEGVLKKEFIIPFVQGSFEDDSLWERSVNGKTYYTKQVGVWYRIHKISPHPLFEEMGLAHRSDEAFFGDWVLDRNGILKFNSEFKCYHSETEIFRKLLALMFEKVNIYMTKYEEDNDWTNELGDY